MPRSILIDASHWGTEHPTGVEQYVDCLFPHLLPLLLKKGFDRIHLLSTTLESPQELPERISWHYAPYRSWWGQEVVLEWQQKLEPSLFFTPSGIPPVKSTVPTALTIHDLSFYADPWAYTMGQHFRLRYMMRRTAKQASIICTPSQVVKEDVQKRWRIPSEKIVVTPLALPESHNLTPAEKPPWLTFKPYILFLGRIEKKKNLVPVLKAFAKLQSTDLHFVLAGGEGVGSQIVHATIKRLPEEVQKRIHLPGFVSGGEKRWLYEHAELYVAPSPYEGFGLPILEAFAAHVPVVCANAGASAEVAHDAAIVVSPFSIDAWHTALDTALHDPALRKECRYKGIERLATFTWETTARLTSEAFTALTPS
jgi:glycosyltransferase involved in cell wall biosynthesis